ncbi:MAG: ATP-binding protein, partial [Myxococcota bacterium]
MSPEENVSELWPFFEADARRSLEEAEEAIIAVKGAENEELEEEVNRLYRVLHTFKGNARMMGLTVLATVTHAAEDLLGLVRSGQVPLSDDVYEVVLLTVDLLAGELPALIESHRDLEEDDVEGVLTRLNATLKSFRGDPSSTSLDLASAPVVLFDELESESGPESLDLSQAPVVLFDELEPSPPAAAPPPPAPKKPRASAAPAADLDPFIQVRSSRIQGLLSLSSDLGLVTDTVTLHPEIIEACSQRPELEEGLRRLRSIVRETRSTAAGLALVPVGTVFRRFGRVTRDIERLTGKSIDLCLEGEDVELDKSVVDALYDPLLHLVRNSGDHGLEGPQERLQAGKPETGTLRLAAENMGNEIVVRVQDDGRGLNRERIRDTAVKRSLIEPEAPLTDEEIDRLILLPGFSTNTEVSALSGRGVGMDVVSDTLQRVKGTIDILSTPGEGTLFALHLPLTLAFVEVLIVEVDACLFAIPLQNVGTVTTATPERVVSSSADGVSYLCTEAMEYPIVDMTQRGLQGIHQPEVLVTVMSPSGIVAVRVSRVRGAEQLTVRPLSPFLGNLENAVAFGLMGSGEVALLL